MIEPGDVWPEELLEMLWECRHLFLPEIKLKKPMDILKIF